MLRVAYIRVSTSSGEQLSALEIQRYRLQAEAPDLLLEDVESGLNPGRSQYQQLKKLIGLGQVVEVLCTRLDRLGRDAAESDAFVLHCDQHGVICRTLDDGLVTMSTPEQLLLTRLKGSLSQGESMKISKRVRDSLKAGRELGKPMRKPCWGYRLSADRMKFELDPEEAPQALRFIKLLKQLSWRMQPALLQFDGPIPISSCRGVKAWLINPTIRGAVAYRQLKNHQFETILWDQHPALISHEDFATMEAVIARNRKHWGHNAHRRLRPLTGLCVCAECGYRLVYIPGRSIPSLRCRGERCSRHYKGTREEAIIRWVITALAAGAAEKLAAAAEQPDNPEVGRLQQQIEALERQCDPDLAEALELKRARMQALINQPEVNLDLAAKISDPRWFDELDYEQLTQLFQRVIEQVVVTNGEPSAIDLKL